MPTTLKLKHANTLSENLIAAALNETSNYTEKVINFLNDVVAPKLDHLVEHPESYTTKNPTSHSFEIPPGVGPTEKFIAEVAHQLEPLGYLVSWSHDGGGMYATVVISWARAMGLVRSTPMGDDLKKQLKK